MHALWLENNELRFRKHVDTPEPSESEARVKVLVTGICATDLEMVKGYHPFTGIPGHEFVGEIVAAPGYPQRVGERVVGEINITCGACQSCLTGRTTHCEKRKVLGIRDYNGAFAEFLCLPLSNLVPIAEDISNDAAVFVEPLAAALEIQEQIIVRPSDRVLVLGAGRLGLMIARILALSNCELHVCARHPEQHRLLEKSGIAWIGENSIPEHAFDIVVEASGSPDGFYTARKAVRPGGTIVLKSTYHGNLEVNLSSIVVDEITLIGSRCGPYKKALDLLEERKIDPTDSIDERFALKDGIKAYQRAAQPGSMKVLLEPWS
jgi:threonine dehydrogenase-like Zn-dependent dehydrogenase